MSKIDNNQLKEDIRKMITETFQEATEFDGTEIFRINPYLHQLLGEATKNPDLMVVFNTFEDLASSDENPVNYILDFANAVAPYQMGNRTIKNIVNSIEQLINDNRYQYEMFKTLYNLPAELNYIQDELIDAYNTYLYDPSEENKLKLLEEIDTLYEGGGRYDELATNLTLMVNQTNELPSVVFDRTSIYESASVQTTKMAAEHRQKKIIQEVFNKVEKYLDQRTKEENEEQKRINETYSLQGIANKNGLRLYDRINEVIKSDAIKNANLRNILSQYSIALKEGAFEERLYETLLHNTAKFDYLLPVERMRNAIMEVAQKKNDQITLTKILEEMIASPASYIYVDIIQEDVARYVREPNEINRVQLRNSLMPFAADPFVSRMFEVIFFDDQKRTPSGEIERQTLNIQEQINLIRENAHVESIYTPIQFIKEGECIFNVHGQYYVKKNNNVALLEKKHIANLDRKFVELCHLVNDPHVHIFEDRIEIRGVEHSATVYEGYVDIAGYHEDKASLRRLDEMYMKYDNYDTNFYIMCSCLLENFSKIANINFGKRIILNENASICADLFKLDEEIHLALHNYDLNTHTLYRRVNPIWCRNTLNEHMGINVEYLFEDMLPNQKKIIMKLYETKNEYESSIEQYEKAIQDLKDAKKETNDESLISDIEQSIEDNEKKLKELKDEYKEWQKETEKQTNDKDITAKEDDEDEASAEADNIEHEKGNEPIDSDEVEDQKAELTVPLTAQNTDEISDQQFDDILAGTDNTEEDIIDTDAIDNGLVTNVDTTDTQIDADGDMTVVDNDSIFDDEPVMDNEEDMSDYDDEDIIQYGDDFEEQPIDAPDMEEVDMSKVSDEEGSEEEIDATDIFGGNVENPLEMNTVEDEIDNFYNPNIKTDDYSIVNVVFDNNLITGDVKKSGLITVLMPYVADNGNQYTDTKNIQFIINDSDNIEFNIDQSETLSAGLYKALKKSVEQHPNYNVVLKSGQPGDPFPEKIEVADETDDILISGEAVPEDEVYADDIIDTDIEIPDVIPGTDIKATFAFDDEDEFNSVFSDDSEEEIDSEEKVTVDVPVPVDVPANVAQNLDTEDAEEDEYDEFVDVFGTDPVQTYTDEDGTEIEFPADNVDDSVIPESKKAGKGKPVNERLSKIKTIKRVRK